MTTFNSALHYLWTQLPNSRRAGLTSSLIALVTRSIDSLGAFLLLPKSIHTLICNSGDWSLHGATRNLCLLEVKNTHNKHAKTGHKHKDTSKHTSVITRLFDPNNKNDISCFSQCKSAVQPKRFERFSLSFTLGLKVMVITRWGNSIRRSHPVLATHWTLFSIPK